MESKNQIGSYVNTHYTYTHTHTRTHASHSANVSPLFNLHFICAYYNKIKCIFFVIHLSVLFSFLSLCARVLAHICFLLLFLLLLLLLAFRRRLIIILK